MRRIAALSFLAVMPFLTHATEGNETSLNDLPGLPVSAIAHVDAQRQAQTNAPALPKPVRQVSVKPGVNEVIPISVGHPSRILVPFSRPQIRTASTAQFEVDEQAIYITASEEGRPVTAFITEAGVPDVALSLTFVPSRMPPVEVSIDLDSSDIRGFQMARPKAKSWEESQPYVQTLRDLMRDVAMGESPQGYTLNENPGTDAFRGCSQSGLDFNFTQGQVLEGHRLRIDVGVISNISEQHIEFREPSCAMGDVRAIAAWPNPILSPGEKTEVFVVRSIEHFDRAPHNSRRSLLEK